MESRGVMLRPFLVHAVFARAGLVHGSSRLFKRHWIVRVVTHVVLNHGEDIRRTQGEDGYAVLKGVRVDESGYDLFYP